MPCSLEREAGGMIGRGPAWQVTLADLSLILFLVTLAGLVSSSRAKEAQNDLPDVPTQALYRAVAEGPSLADWLDESPVDPRAILTIHVTYSEGGSDWALVTAQNWLDEASRTDTPSRVVIAQGEANDIYARLAYDAP